MSALAGQSHVVPHEPSGAACRLLDAYGEGAARDVDVYLEQAVGGIGGHLVALGVEVTAGTALDDGGLGLDGKTVEHTGGVEVAGVVALTVSHLAGHGVAAVGQAGDGLREVEVGRVPHLHGTVEALVAPCAAHVPSEAVASKLRVDDEGSGINTLSSG